MQNNIDKSITVKSIIRAVDILKCLRDGLDSITEISKQLNLGKGTVHRLLKTLEDSGFVIQDVVNRKYYLGPFVISLASNPMISHQRLVMCAHHEMQQLRDHINETIVLQVRIGMLRVCLEEISSNHNIKFTLGKGFVSSLLTGSGGKILLSELEPSELKLLLKNLKYSTEGNERISSDKDLLAELAEIKKQGYATSFGELIDAAASISVPIRNYVIPAALSVAGPDFRFTNMMDYLEEIKESANRISQNLGDTGHV